MNNLIAILETNPNKDKTLPPIDIKIRSDTQEGENVPKTLCGWVPTPMEPPGPLAVVLWKTNPEFRAGTPSVKRTILRETILKLLERIDSELKGHKWSKKKVIEQLNQKARNNLPRDPILIFEPATLLCSFIPTRRQFLPVIVHFLLGIAKDLEGNRLVKFEGRTSVQRCERLTI